MICNNGDWRDEMLQKLGRRRTLTTLKSDFFIRNDREDLAASSSGKKRGIILRQTGALRQVSIQSSNLTVGDSNRSQDDHGELQQTFLQELLDGLLALVGWHLALEHDGLHAVLQRHEVMSGLN